MTDEQHVVIVTGSRSLERERSLWRARDVIFDALDEMQPSVVVAGDAVGPDTWAIQWADEYMVPWNRWHVNGALWSETHTGDPVIRQWCKNADWHEARRRLGARIPLFRNEQMVRVTASTYQRVSMLAVIDSASRTRGTQHTVSIARSIGMDVREVIL